MPDYEEAIFISYAWGGECEEIVNLIDQAFQNRGINIIRDKRDLGYKGSIREFMERIGHGSCILLVINDKYLRSPNCMYELVEIAEEKQFYDRIFPIVLRDANIYEPLKRIEFIKESCKNNFRFSSVFWLAVAQKSREVVFTRVLSQMLSGR